MRLAIQVIQPGAHTTIQDLGRPNLRAIGMPLGGATDPVALRIANWLVGNRENAAAIECRLVGPRLKFQVDTIIAIAGANSNDCPTWRPFAVRKGESIDLSHLREGVYTYVAVSGGIDVPEVLGSRSTDTRIHVGGLEGRILRAGDVLPVSLSRKIVADDWRVNPASFYSRDPIRVIRGEQWQEFQMDDQPASERCSDRRLGGSEAQQSRRDGGLYNGSLTGQVFRISSKSDRMGVRLWGEPLKRCGFHDLPSGPVAPGTIQVPPDGNPIVLLADAQTLGGYPKVAHVVSVDLPRMSQLRPGARVEFVEVTLEEAHLLQHRRAKELAMLRQGIMDKLK